MSEAPTLPIAYTTQQLLDMCIQVLLDATQTDHDLAVLNGRQPKFKVWPEPENVRDARLAYEDQKAELEQKILLLRATAQEHANALVGRKVILTGTVLRFVTEWASASCDPDAIDDYVIGGSHQVMSSVPLDIENSKQTITRVEMQNDWIGGTRARVYFKYYGGAEYFFELPYLENIIVIGID